jgi:hypothetical protein
MPLTGLTSTQFMPFQCREQLNNSTRILPFLSRYNNMFYNLIPMLANNANISIDVNLYILMISHNTIVCILMP